jgi:hypothetical protein
MCYPVEYVHKLGLPYLEDGRPNDLIVGFLERGVGTFGDNLEVDLLLHYLQLHLGEQFK